MAAKDRLVYFDVYGRGEPIRMLYAIAGEEFEDERVSIDQWAALKAEQPLGQLPVLHTAEGNVLCQTSTIARYVARKLGLVGSGQWEETLHDLVMESTQDIIYDVPAKIYSWKLRKNPEPEDSEKLIAEVREGLLKKLPYIQSIAEKRGKKYIVGDTIGLAEIWFYTSIDFISLAFPDSKELTPWIKGFVEKMEADEKIKSHLASRPPSFNRV